MAAPERRFCVDLNVDRSWYHLYQAPLDGNWKSVSYTHVDYPAGDLLGKLLAYSSLVPVFLMVSFVTLIFFRRELHTMTYFLGVILNELINQVLKYSLRAPRPCRASESHSIVYGMPSSHAQFMGFFSTYMTCFLLIRLPRQSDGFADHIWREITAFGAILLALVVSYSRIYLRYHTTAQVVVGLVIGIFLALFWFNFTETVLTPLFPVIVSWQRQRRASVKSK